MKNIKIFACPTAEKFTKEICESIHLPMGKVECMKRKPQIIIGIALITLFVILAVAAPILVPNDPNATNLALKNAPPSAEYPLGCDQMGRCELSRLIYGARYSLGLSIPVLIAIAAITLFVGCYSSYKGGILDEIIRLVCDILMAFPLIVIAMALVSAVDNSVASIMIAIGISMASWFLRMVRSYAKTECGKEYIEASKISGASNFRQSKAFLLFQFERICFLLQAHQKGEKS